MLLRNTRGLMKYRKLGNTGINISAFGPGCMGISFAYGAINDRESIKTPLSEKYPNIGQHYNDGIIKLVNK